ncbi:MAG: hypothetical protein WCF85_19785 [Rhodospirillaceae bacterium]
MASPDRLFPMPAVAKAAGTTVENIRNYVHRGVLLYPGCEPRAGYPREFPLYGAYEVVLLHHFQRAGLTLDAAKAIWRALVELQQERERAEGIEATAAPPRALPDALTGDSTAGKLLAVAVRSDKAGRAGAVKVLVRELLWGDLISLRRGFQTLFPAAEADPPLQTYLFDLCRVIAAADRELQSIETKPDTSQ